MDIPEIILTATLTLIGGGVGVLIGVHLARRAHGLIDRWEGWASEIQFIKQLLGWR